MSPGAGASVSQPARLVLDFLNHGFDSGFASAWIHARSSE